MKSAFLTIGLVLSVGVGQAQVRFKVEAQGVPEASASYLHKVLADGSKQVQLSMEFVTRDGKKLRIRIDRTYAKNGAPIRVFSDTSSEKPRYKKTATATFNTQGAHVVVDENGKRTVKTIELAATAPRECLSEFWFIRDQPKVGEICKYYHFDIDKLDWRIVESRYVGPTNYKLGGQTIAGHRVKTATGEAILDAMGQPLRIVDAAVTLIRTVP